MNVSFTDCSGIGEIPAVKKLRIFPNPNDGRFSLQISTTEKIAADLMVYDAAGKIFYQQSGLEIQGNFISDIRLPELKAGLYYLIIQNEEGTIVKKVIVR